MRIAATADLHCTATASGVLQPVFADMAGTADVLLLCGDLTDNGRPEEARVLARELSTVGQMPVVAVLGNHDYEAGRAEELRDILLGAGVVVLDGGVFEVDGVGFAGVKGFGGGFGARALQPWGEDAIKRFVHEALEEAMKLESGLARLRTSYRVALLHYSPIEETVEGEPREIYPFLGSSRLEQALGRYPVNAVFHGHAHNGRPAGHTAEGVPVFNVCLPMRRRLSPDAPPFHVLEVPGVPVAVDATAVNAR